MYFTYWPPCFALSRSAPGLQEASHTAGRNIVRVRHALKVRCGCAARDERVCGVVGCALVVVFDDLGSCLVMPCMPRHTLCSRARLVGGLHSSCAAEHIPSVGTRNPPNVVCASRPLDVLPAQHPTVLTSDVRGLGLVRDSIIEPFSGSEMIYPVSAKVLASRLQAPLLATVTKILRAVRHNAHSDDAAPYAWLSIQRCLCEVKSARFPAGSSKHE